MKYMTVLGSLVELDKVGYVGKTDRHIKHDVKGGSTTYYLPVVVDGCYLELKDKGEWKEVEAARNELLENLKCSTE